MILKHGAVVLPVHCRNSNARWDEVSSSIILTQFDGFISPGEYTNSVAIGDYYILFRSTLPLMLAIN